MIDRTQFFVLLYFGFARIGLVVILLIDSTIYDSIMELTAGLCPLASLAYLGGIPILIAVLGVPADLGRVTDSWSAAHPCPRARTHRGSCSGRSRLVAHVPGSSRLGTGRDLSSGVLSIS